MTTLGELIDEAIHGHRLRERGLRDALHSRAAEVRNSSWIAAGESGNRVHEYHDPVAYARLKHYILLLKDSTVECLAEGYSISLYTEKMSTVLVSLVDRVAK